MPGLTLGLRRVLTLIHLLVNNRNVKNVQNVHYFLSGKPKNVKECGRDTRLANDFEKTDKTGGFENPGFFLRF